MSPAPNLAPPPAPRGASRIADGPAPGQPAGVSVPPRFNVLGTGISALTLDAARDFLLSARGGRQPGKWQKWTLRFDPATGAKLLINDIVASRPDADFYDAKVTVLSEEIKHHVHVEEMRSEGMFAQCRDTDVDLVELRDKMIARKQELMAQAKSSSGLPPAEPRAVNLQPA